MSRPLPAAFKEKDTYGINTDQGRDRITEVDGNARGTLSDILIGKRELPIRMAIAGLQKADSAEDVGRLVLGALICASGTPVSAVKLLSATDAYVDSVRIWSNRRVFGIDENGEKVSKAANSSDAGDALPFPHDVFPSWFANLEIEDEDAMLAWSVDEIEAGAYAGVLAHAIGKQPNAENLEAFNQKRRNAVTQFVTSGQLQLFVDDSPYLSLETLGKVNRAFNTIAMDRAIVFSAIVDRDGPLKSGMPRMFYSIFRLSSGASLNPLLIITRFARKYPQFYAEFPDLETEFHAAAHALARFYDVNEKRRMYLKVIFGSDYVPVPRADVDSLLGVAVFTLQQTERSLQNYNGGTLSVAHREKLLSLLNVSAAKEEDVPES